MAFSGEKFDRIDRDTTKSRLCFKPRKRFLKIKRLRIEPWSGVPVFNRVIKVLNIRDGGLSIARERGSNAGNCFSEQKRIIVYRFSDMNSVSRRNERSRLQPSFERSDVDKPLVWERVAITHSAGKA